MAETAKVLNPEKTVLIPAEKAGCSLAEGITPDDVLALKAIYPGAPVVTYVNTYASVKAVSDYCCTSGNAAAVIRYLRQKWDASLFPAPTVASRARKASARVIEPPEIGKRPNFCVVFIPDEYLARNTARDLGLEYVPAPNPLEGAPEFAGVAHGQPSVIGWRSRCEVHELYTVQDVDNARKQWPDVVILAHPECHPDVIAKVDFVGSTKGMIDYVKNVDSPRYLLFTECSMGDNVAAEFPHREMVRACSLRCKHMNLITLEQTLASLQKLQYAVELPDDIIQNARLPIERMLAIR
jgi:quinolinate synthase